MSDTQKDSGSFITGFGMGLITGAAAYFLFATEQGKELRKRALVEWESAQKMLSEEAGIEVPKSMKQFMQEAVGYFAESIKEIQDIQEGKVIKSSPLKAKKPVPKVKPSGRFKGL